MDVVAALQSLLSERETAAARVVQIDAELEQARKVLAEIPARGRIKPDPAPDPPPTPVEAGRIKPDVRRQPWAQPAEASPAADDADPPARRSLADAIAPPTPIAKVDTPIVEARDAAILKYMRHKNGLASTQQLKAAMPIEHALSLDQRNAAFHNTMSRLRTKKQVERTGDTWSLVGIGSSVAHG